MPRPGSDHRARHAADVSATTSSARTSTLRDAAGAPIGPRKTDDGGRATFDGLRPGTTYRAVAVVSGERLESQPFTQPASGGVRVVLVAGIGPGASAGGAPGRRAAGDAGPSGAGRQRRRSARSRA